MLLNTVVMRIVGIPFAAAGSCISLALGSQSHFFSYHLLQSQEEVSHLGMGCRCQNRIQRLEL